MLNTPTNGRWHSTRDSVQVSIEVNIFPRHPMVEPLQFIAGVVTDVVHHRVIEIRYVKDIQTAIPLTGDDEAVGLGYGFKPEHAHCKKNTCCVFEKNN